MKKLRRRWVWNIRGAAHPDLRDPIYKESQVFGKEGGGRTRSFLCEGARSGGRPAGWP